MPEQIKIKLRKPLMSDVSKILHWENDPHNKQFTSFDAKYDRKDIEALILSNDDIKENKQVRMIVADEYYKAIGAVDLYSIDFESGQAGVGILIDEGHRRKGCAHYALLSIEKFAKEKLSLNQLYCEIPVKNKPSAKLFEGAGYTLKDKRKNLYQIDSLPVDVYFYEKNIQ